MSLKYSKSLLSALALAGACGANAAEGGDTPAIVTPAVADFNTCPKPEWPKKSLRNNETGTVTLRFLIGDDGTVLDSLVMKSSGFAALDEAAMAGIRRCKFKPRTVNAELIGAWMTMQYVWSLSPSAAELKAAQEQAEAYRAEALNGDVGALYKLAQHFRGQGSKSPRNPAYAARMLRLAAERGHAQAEYEVANSYHFGSGVPKSEQEALAWYRKAAEHGSPDAQARLAWNYESGRGMARDPEQALDWYRKAAAQGNTYAQVQLSRLFLAGRTEAIDQQQALDYLRNAAGQRDPRAEGLLANVYLDGKHAPLDVAEGMRYLRRAAIGGDVASMALLGNLLTQGQHTEADPAQGQKWLRKAAASGACQAKQRLAKADDARPATCGIDAGPPPVGV